MNVVELFAGIGGFRIASDNLGLKTVWANEFEPLAASVYSQNFGSDVLRIGDINDLQHEVPVHDLLTAGFPCQPFSSAGKKKGIKDPRGTLFQVIVNIIKNRKPKYFVLENVKRLLTMQDGYHFATILNYLGELGYTIEWKLLNATDFGLPQNRERVIIIGYRGGDGAQSLLLTEEEARKVSTEIEPAILLESLLWDKVSDHTSRFLSWGLLKNQKFIMMDVKTEAPKYSISMKNILENNVDERYFFNEGMAERIKNSVKVNKFVNGVEVLFNQKGGARMGYTIFGINGLAPTLTCTASRHYERYKIDGNYRRLTPVEYARLQGFPEDHCMNISPYNQYSLFGNAVPPQMVQWAMHRLIRQKPVNLVDYIDQMVLFNG